MAARATTLFKLKPPKPPPLREKHIIRQCRDWLALRGYMSFRLHSGMFKTPDGRWITMNEEGTPDYVCVHGSVHGRLHPGFLLETKAPGEELSEAQVKRHQELREAYGVPVSAVD